MTRNEGPSYSSSTSSIDLRAKVMPLQETKGCLQQLQWRSVLLVCECLNAYVSNVNLPPPPFSPPFHSLTFSPFSPIVCHGSLCMNCIQSSARPPVFTAHVKSLPLSAASDKNSRQVCFSHRGGRPARPFCQHMKSNHMLGTPDWKLESVKRVQEWSRAIFSHLTDQGVYPFPIAFCPCWIKTKLFSVLVIFIFFPAGNSNTRIIRFLHSRLIKVLIMHGLESKAHWCFSASFFFYVPFLVFCW